MTHPSNGTHPRVPILLHPQPGPGCVIWFNCTLLLTLPLTSTWNSGGLLYAPNAINGSKHVWNLYYGSRRAIATVAGPEGITSDFVDIECVGRQWPEQRPVPTFRLRNGSWRGFWQRDWPTVTRPNCTWPCHRQRLVGLTGTDTPLLGDPKAVWSLRQTGQLEEALPFVWSELTPNVENPVVIPSSDGKEFLMVFDALSMNASCRESPACGWVGEQCWSTDSCNAIGLAWSEDGEHWVEAEHVVIQYDHQCGLVRTPIGLVPEPDMGKGYYSVLYTGWLAPDSAAAADDNGDDDAAVPKINMEAPGVSRLQDHAKVRTQCSTDDERCQTYMGFKPLCSAIIRNNREAE